MKYLSALIGIALLGSSFATGSLAQHNEYTIREEGSPTAREVLSWHEVFTYEVRYSFFNLGTVRIEVTDTLYHGEPAWHLSGVITSNPGIPFVGKEENHYNSIFTIDDGRPRERVYWKDNVDEQQFNEDRYVYNYDLKKVFAFRKGEATDTLDLEQPATSGPLIFLFSRLHAGQHIDSRLYIYLDEEQGHIDMEYTHRQDDREYAPFQYPVDAYYATGHADIDGPFGFSGNFKAWFANDDLRIPLEAHVKVWLGNVKVRLIEYNKEVRNE